MRIMQRERRKEGVKRGSASYGGSDDETNGDEGRGKSKWIVTLFKGVSVSL